MNILLDECVPKPLKLQLPEHTVLTVREMGWNSIKNGQLLALAAEHGFDVLLTVDRNMQYQQNSLSLPCSVIVLRSRSNRLEALLPFVPQIQTLLAALPNNAFLELFPPEL